MLRVTARATPPILRRRAAPGPVPPIARTTAMAVAAVAVALAPVIACGCGGDGRPPANDGGLIEALPGLAGYALAFDGVDDYATAGDAEFPIAYGDQTISMWVNFGSVTGTQDFIALRQDFTSGVQVGVRDATIAVWTTYAGRTLVAAPLAPSIAVWHHVAYTYDRVTHRLYVDGGLVASTSATADRRTPTSAWLGTVDGSAELFKGKLDEVRVWKVARTEAELAADMFHRPPRDEAALVAYWTFDDTALSGHSHDWTGLGNDVTLGDGIASRMPARIASDAPAAP